MACRRNGNAVNAGGLLAMFALALLVEGCASRTREQKQAAGQMTNDLLIPIHRTITVVTTNQLVFVGGEVKNPARIIWTNGLTLTSAIEVAGGFTDFANRSRLELRRFDGALEVFRYAAIRRGMTNDPVLRPNDQVYVGKRGTLPPEVWTVLRTLL